MKKKTYNVLIGLLLLVGVGILSYPMVSNLWNQHQQDKVIRGYKKVVDEYSTEQIDVMWKEARLYNQDLLKDEIIVDPFTQVVDKKANVKYYETLNPWDNGVMGSIRIPSIDVDLPLYHGTSEDVLQKAIGHLEQTSLPIGGKGTHAVVSGHRGLPSAKLFSDLNLIEEGDLFFLDILDETLAYEVDQIKVVEPNELEDLAIDHEQDYVTLVTCTPYSINSHRLLVRGTRVPYVESMEAKESNIFTASFEYLPYLVALIVVLVILIIWVIKNKRTIGGV